MTWRAPTIGGVATVTNIAQALTITINAVATAQTAGLTLENTTAAAAGAQQYSPMLVLEGQGWKTDATAASRLVEWAFQNRPVQGAANPTSVLDIMSQINSGGWTKPMTLTSDGTATVLTGYNAGNYGFRMAGGVSLTTSSAQGYLDSGTTQLHIRVNEVDQLAFTLTDATFSQLIKWVAGNEQLTVGAAGAASAPPATPTKYVKIKDSAGTTLVVPCYAAV